MKYFKKFMNACINIIGYTLGLGALFYAALYAVVKYDFIFAGVLNKINIAALHLVN